MAGFVEQLKLTLSWAFRDRLFYAIFGVALAMLLLVPLLSSFSMRQVQELSITLVLSLHTFTLMIVAVLLGTTSLWREIERRYSYAVLTLPVTRRSHLFGKFAGVTTFLCCCGLLLGAIGALLIVWSSLSYPSEVPVVWSSYLVAISGATLQSILIAAIALFFTTVGTSFFLPFFSTLAVYLAGSGSQQVYEYISGKAGETLPPLALALIKGVYYLLPNFAAFDFKVYAIYALPLPGSGILLTICYWAVYSAAVLFFAARAFEHRELL